MSEDDGLLQSHTQTSTLPVYLSSTSTSTPTPQIKSPMPCPMAWTSQTPRVLPEMHARRVLSVSTKSHPAPRRVSTVALENTPTSSLSPLAATVSQEHTRTRSLPRRASPAPLERTRKSLASRRAHSARKTRFLQQVLAPRQHVRATRAITTRHAVMPHGLSVAATFTRTQKCAADTQQSALLAVARVPAWETRVITTAFASHAVRASTTTQTIFGRA